MKACNNIINNFLKQSYKFQSSCSKLKLFSKFNKFSNRSFTNKSKKSNPSDFEKCVENLHEILDSEQNYEKDNYKPINKLEKLSFCKNSGFVLFEEEYSPNLVLTKETVNYTLSIHFLAREPVNTESEEFPEEIDHASRLTELINNDEIDQLKLKERDSFKIRIKIINKSNKNKESSEKDQSTENLIENSSGFFFAGDYFNNTLNIDHMYSGDQVNEVHKNYYTIKEDFSKHYYGPTWSDMTVDVKNEIMKYLEDLGVTVELLEFIEIISQDKDQRLYMIWLEEVKKFFTI